MILNVFLRCPNITTRRSKFRLHGLLLAVSALLAAPSVQSANLFWDTDGATAGAGGGTTPTGTWDDVTANWTLSSTGTSGTTAAWNDAGNDTAIFSAGTTATGAFTVTLVDTRIAGGVTFQEGAVTISGGDELTLTSGGIVSVSAASATIQSVIGGGVGLTKQGTGLLTLSGANTFTGDLTVNVGTVRASTSADALGLGTVDLMDGTTLQLADDAGLAFNNDTSVLGTVTIESDRVTAGAGVTHTLGALSIGNGDTLDLLNGSNVTADTDYGLTFGATTFTGDLPTFNVTNNGTGIGTLTLGSLLGGSGFDFTKQGAGTLVLAGPSATTNIDVLFDEGTIRLADEEALGDTGVSPNIDLTMATGTRLELGTDSSVDAYRLFIDGDATVVSDRATSGVGSSHTLGALSIGAQTLAVEAGGNLTSGTAAVGFGATTLTSSGTVFDVGSGASLTLASVAPSAGAQRNFTVEGAGNTTITGAITTSSGASTLTKNGTGTLTLQGTSTFTGATTINGGTLDATVAGALGSTSGVDIGSGTATLALTGSGNLNRVNNAAGISIAGGSILKGSGASEGSATAAGLGTLTLSASSTIDFGIGGVGVLAFAGFTPAGFTLTIANWTGSALTVGNATTDRLIFAADQSANLAAYSFTGYGGGAVQFDLGGGMYEIVPVPEPSTVLGALALLGVVGWRERRQFLRVR